MPAFARYAVAALAMLITLALAACGDDTEPIVTVPTDPNPTSASAPTNTPGAAPAGPRIEIVSENIAFDTDELRAPADTDFTIVDINDDIGIPHNFALFRDAAHLGLIARTDIMQGPAEQELAIPPLEPGTYYFLCQTHTDQMTGTLIAE
jgi:hypothetical protein